MILNIMNAIITNLFQFFVGTDLRRAMTFSLFIFLVMLIITRVNFKEKRKDYLRELYFKWLTAIIIMILVMIIPVLESEYSQGINFLTGLFDTILIFTAGKELPFESAQIFEEIGVGTVRTYLFILSILFIVAPLLTIGGITQFFFDWFTKVRMTFYSYSKKPLYIFSNLNNSTIQAGKGLKGYHIIYYDSTEFQNDESYLREEAKDIGAIVVNRDIQNLTFNYNNFFTTLLSFFYFVKKASKRFFSTFTFSDIGKLWSNLVEEHIIKCNNVNIFLVNDNDVDNITDLTTLIKDKKLKKCSYVNIYIFCNTELYETALDNFIKKNEKDLKNINIILIDELKNSIYNLFQNYKLYENISNDKKEISLLVIGDSRVAREAIRIASWNSQFLDYDVTITSVSDNPEEFRRDFEFLYPELKLSMSEHSKFVSTSEFPELYHRSDPTQGFTKLQIESREHYPNYIIVAYEDEILNLKTGWSLATIFYQKVFSRKDKNINKVPVISTWTKSESLSRQFKTENLNIFSIVPFGSYMEQFNIKNILNQKYDSLGFNVHALYNGFYKVENYYGRNISEDINLISNNYLAEDDKLLLKNINLLEKNIDEEENYLYLINLFLDHYELKSLYKTNKRKRYYLKNSDIYFIIFLKSRFHFFKRQLYEISSNNTKLKFDSNPKILNELSALVTLLPSLKKRVNNPDITIVEEFEDLLKSYYQKNYDRSSSLATGLHNSYKRRNLAILEAEDRNKLQEVDLIEKQLSDLNYLSRLKKKFSTKLERLEHNRWMAYMRSKGYQNISMEDLTYALFKEFMIENKDDSLKYTNCLVEWSSETVNENNTPLEGKNFESYTLDELNEMIESGEYDELDLVTLKSWRLLKIGNNETKLEDLGVKVDKFKKNFKTIDRDILNIMDLDIISQSVLDYLIKPKKIN